MPWREQTVFEQRKEFVVLASHKGSNVSQLCKRYGISRKTGYKWLSRARGSDGEEEALQNRSRRPRHSPVLVEVFIFAPPVAPSLKNPHFLQHPQYNSPQHAVAAFGLMHMGAAQHLQA